MSNDEIIVSKVIETLKITLEGKKKSLHEPHFFGKEWDYLKETIDSSFVSSIGTYVNFFEKKLSEFTKAKYAIATVNGTSALHIALILAGVKKDDEVLLPTLSFVATANAIVYNNAIPHFIDNDYSSLGIDHKKLLNYLETNTKIENSHCINKKTNRIIRAIVPMHTFGHPVDMDPIIKIGKRFNIEIVEDAAESLGSYYKKKHTGTFGTLSALSFNGNKIITTGGGGAILTNNPKIAKKAKHLTTTAKIKHPWKFIHDDVGFNYRMPNINAALGCAQMENLNHFLKNKRKLFNLYKKSFQLISEVEVVSEPGNCKSNYWLQTLRLKKRNNVLKEMIIERANQIGISCRPTWTLLHKMKPFKNFPRMDLSNASYHEQTLINIPSSSQIMDI